MLNNLFVTGAHGVDVFIVVSGFCLALPYTKSSRSVDVHSFYKRRAYRIAPPYYVALAVASALAIGPGTWHWVVAEQANAGDIALAAMFLQAWAGVEGTVNGSLWSVALEVSLYLVFPLLVLWWQRFSLSSLVVISGVLAVAWFEAPIDGPSMHLVLPARLVQFAIGMWCAQLISRRSVSTLVSASAAFAAVIAGVTLSTLNLLGPSLLAWGAAGGSLCLLVVTLGERGTVWKLAERAGQVSYSFYLMHQPVLLVFFYWFQKTGTSWMISLGIGLTVALAASYVVGLLLYVTVEQPSAKRSQFIRPTPAKGNLSP